MWWGNVEQRKKQKEAIKVLIKRTKLTEKATVHLSPNSVDSPPELSRSLPTSDTLSDTIARQRSLSVESGYTLYEPEHDVGGAHHGMYPHPHHMHHQHHHFSGAPAPFSEFDGFAQPKESFVNGFPLPRRPSSTSSFAMTRQNSLSVAPEQQQFTAASQSVPPQQPPAEDTSSFFDFQRYEPQTPTVLPYIPVEGADRQLLDHFLSDVQRLIFPILNLHGTARSDVILPALAHNECYRHCCLSISALHIKTTAHLAGRDAEYVDQDITRHRYRTISGLCEALAQDADHLQILEATLGMILFQTAVGSPNDTLPDIPWHQHFQAAISLVNKLELHSHLNPLSLSPASRTKTLSMTLTAWIDILGNTLLGRAPQFADTYREKHLSSGLSGFRESMGCDDRVMYLISETACLEALKAGNMLSDMELCEHVKSLAFQIDMTETPCAPSSSDESVNHLTNSITAAFRFAARIYLCSLVPGFDKYQPQVHQLLDKLMDCLAAIPGGSEGFDRCLVWVLLIGGSVAGPRSEFRQWFEGRCQEMGEGMEWGSFGRMRRVLEAVWREEEETRTSVHWRDVMKREGWEDLLL
jgi:hypothetical protein